MTRPREGSASSTSANAERRRYSSHRLDRLHHNGSSTERVLLVDFCVVVGRQVVSANDRVVVGFPRADARVGGSPRGELRANFGLVELEVGVDDVLRVERVSGIHEKSELVSSGPRSSPCTSRPSN